MKSGSIALTVVTEKLEWMIILLDGLSNVILRMLWLSLFAVICRIGCADALHC